MNVPAGKELTPEQVKMNDRIIGASCLLALAAGYENASGDRDDAEQLRFHEEITRDLILDLGYCMHVRFGEGNGEWAFELAAEGYPVRWWRQALALGYIPLILRERQGYPPLANYRISMAYAKRQHFAYTDLNYCRACGDFTIHRVTESARRCEACNTLDASPDHDIIIIHPLE